MTGRRQFLQTAGGALASVGLFRSAARANARRPNVLFLAVDDLNDWIGCMGGHPNALTPNLDRLARRGTLFANAHCQAPVCGPSRASLMTGLRPSTTGIYGQINDQRLRAAGPATAEAPFLFEYFRAHGYHTMAVGKLFHGHVPEGTVDESGGRAKGFGPLPPKRMKWDTDKTSTDWGAFPDSPQPSGPSSAWGATMTSPSCWPPGSCGRTCPGTCPRSGSTCTPPARSPRRRT